MLPFQGPGSGISSADKTVLEDFRHGCPVLVDVAQRCSGCGHRARSGWDAGATGSGFICYATAHELSACNAGIVHVVTALAFGLVQPQPLWPSGK